MTSRHAATESRSGHAVGAIRVSSLSMNVDEGRTVRGIIHDSVVTNYSSIADWILESQISAPVPAAQRPRVGHQPAGEYLSIAETAALMKVSAKTIRNKLAAGTFPREVYSRRAGSAVRFLKSKLTQYMQSNTPMLVSTEPLGRAYVGLERVHRRRRHA